KRLPFGGRIEEIRVGERHKLSPGNGVVVLLDQRRNGPRRIEAQANKHQNRDQLEDDERRQQSEQPGHQCLKCRRPVKSIAIWCSLQAAIVSGSLRLPPGWMTALIPAFAAMSIPSRNGKKASEATTPPALRPCDLCAAIITES